MQTAAHADSGADSGTDSGADNSAACVNTLVALLSMPRAAHRCRATLV